MNIKVNRICDILLDGLEHNLIGKAQFSVAGYVREFRTIGAILPRQTGKTTYLQYLQRHESSLLFVPNLAAADKSFILDGSTATFASIENLEARFRGRRSNGLKYRCFLVDEFQFMTTEQESALYHLVNTLAAGNMLHKDFFILKLGT